MRTLTGSLLAVAVTASLLVAAPADAAHKHRHKAHHHGKAVKGHKHKAHHVKAAKSKPLVIKVTAPVVPVQTAPPMLPNVGPCQMFIVKYIDSLGGYYTTCG